MTLVSHASGTLIRCRSAACQCKNASCTVPSASAAVLMALAETAQFCSLKVLTWEDSLVAVLSPRTT
ncbi:hypothetical protein [Nonomuraea wenchangensis]|uniref:hypothetical protein n=1 Tax=Nonomuraea wenchangensis TaxID=568860 RepID=UPI00331D52D2